MVQKVGIVIVVKHSETIYGYISSQPFPQSFAVLRTNIYDSKQQFMVIDFSKQTLIAPLNPILKLEVVLYNLKLLIY